MTERAALLARPLSPTSVRADSPEPEDTGKFGNSYCRWTLLYAFLVIIISTLPLWLSAATPQYSVLITTCILGAFALEWFAIAFCAVKNFRRIGYAPIADPSLAKEHRERHFVHVVIVPCYLDPLDVLMDCVRTLADQREPKKLCVVVTFEKKTPNLPSMMSVVKEEFGGVFNDLLVVVHELKGESEIPGKCSNINYAIREAFNHIKRSHTAFDMTHYTITTCDPDSKFPAPYFEVLEMSYNAENPRNDQPIKMCVWQPPLFYNWNLDERPFFNRVTCVMRSMMMLGGLISLNLNPMSFFSYPLELGYHAGFINPRYSVDDIIAKVRWMCDTDSPVPVKLLPLAVINGPTCGANFQEEVYEWGRQIRRWTLGSSESFHYFIIHWKGKPFFRGLHWFFLFFSYYGILLCSGGLLGILCGIPLPWADDWTFTVGSTTISLKHYAALGALVLQYIAFAVAFIIDAFATRHLHIKEEINILRNIFHWITAPFVLIVYSLIALVSVLRFVMQGKRMAQHDMSAKDVLSPSSPTGKGTPGSPASVQ